ncbi:MAG: PAS domain S-box protein, partial [Blastocatellia bacterium]
MGHTTTDINLYADPPERIRLRKVLQDQGRIKNAEVRRRVKGGEVRVALTSSEIIYVAGQRCVLTASQDITERILVEAALRDSEERYRTITETASDGIITIDENSTILFVNRAGQEIFGYSSNEMIGRELTMLMPDHLRQVHRSSIKRYIETGQRHLSWEAIQVPGLHKNGKEIPLELSFGEFVRGDKHYFTGIVRDISERRRTEDALLKLGTIVETTDDAIIGKTLDGTIVSWNGGAETIYGYSATDVIGHSISILVPPGRENEVPVILARLRNGEHIRHYETLRVRKDAKTIGVSLSISPIKDKSGNIVGAATIARDITERQSLEEQLRQSQKMEAIGKLAGGVAHDFNNLLTAIIGYSQIMSTRIDQGDPMHTALVEIEKAGRRAAGLTKQLLAFSRKQMLQPEVLDLNKVVSGTENILRRLIG